nr:MAG TPA: hypothetical protein [Caudoviricetes sp.]
MNRFELSVVFIPSSVTLYKLTTFPIQSTHCKKPLRYMPLI